MRDFNCTGPYTSARAPVRVEAQFAVGEYDIVILGADDSAALATWLRAHRYTITAKVNPAEVSFAEGRAVLSPIRVEYDDERFQLPTRLGMLSSAGSSRSRRRPRSLGLPPSCPGRRPTRLAPSVLRRLQ